MKLTWTNGGWLDLDAAKSAKARRVAFEDNLKDMYHHVRIKVLRCRRTGPQRYRVCVRVGKRAAERMVEDLEDVYVKKEA